MPVGFLTQEQRDGFGRYVEAPSREELERFFHLSDDDHKAILPLRGEHSRACPVPQKHDRRGPTSPRVQPIGPNRAAQRSITSGFLV
jgi:hypothetical protein